MKTARQISGSGQSILVTRASAIQTHGSELMNRDYFTALKAGHFTQNPAALNDPTVCDAFRA